MDDLTEKIKAALDRECYHREPQHSGCWHPSAYCWQCHENEHRAAAVADALRDTVKVRRE